MPCWASWSTMGATAAAASSLFTVTRTSSDPARARAATCCTVPGMSAVSVLVIDCTTTGASEPTRTPPTMAVTVFLRWIFAIWEVLFYHARSGGLSHRRMVLIGGAKEEFQVEGWGVRGKMTSDQERNETSSQTRFQAVIFGRRCESVGNSAEAGGKDYHDVWRYCGVCA